MRSVVISLSGGLDSLVLLAIANADMNVRVARLVGFSYGSKHNPWEIAAASRIATHYHLPYEIINLTSAVRDHFKSNLLKGGGNIPEGHYEAESMRATVVPGRNILFAAYLAGYAESNKIEEIWLGIHAGDHAIYPDCRPAFFTAMHTAIAEGTDGRVSLCAPLLYHTKIDIVRRGAYLNAPMHLARTCYQDQEVACGKCGSCQERLTAFAALGLSDPIQYVSREILPKV